MQSSDFGVVQKMAKKAFNLYFYTLLFLYGMGIDIVQLNQLFRRK